MAADDSIKLCECGCGLPAPIATNSEPKKGRVAGQPSRFVKGHYRRPWLRNEYPEGTDEFGEKQRVHRIRAARALGKPLPLSAVVHHVDGTKRKDAQLVICQDQRYHCLLHVRTRVVRAGGNPNTHKFCQRCQLLKPYSAFGMCRTHFDGLANYCKSCCADIRRERRLRLGHY